MGKHMSLICMTSRCNCVSTIEREGCSLAVGVCDLEPRLISGRVEPETRTRLKLQFLTSSVCTSRRARLDLGLSGHGFVGSNNPIVVGKYYPLLSTNDLPVRPHISTAKKIDFSFTC